jgi:hypothetical protein
MAVFWVVAPCSLVEVYQRFRGPCCLHHQLLIVLMMEAARTSETLVNFYQTAILKEFALTFVFFVHVIVFHFALREMYHLTL